MKRFKYLLAAITICLLASCGNSSSMQGYVTEKMAEYSRTCVKFNRLTTSEDILDLSKSSAGLLPDSYAAQCLRRHTGMCGD